MFAGSFSHIGLEARRFLSPMARRVNRLQLFQAAALFIALAAAWPLLAEPGLNATRGGGDSPFLLQRLQQLETALKDGHFPARWMPDANYGYGFPFFQFYASLSFYIAAIFRLIGFSYVGALELAQLSGFGVAAWAMFRLGRRWFSSEWAGLLASAAYSLAPFHLVNVYVRGDSLGEFWAMAFYPLVILVGENLVIGRRDQDRSRAQLAFFALSYAGLILSHNISALIFTPFLLLYLALRWGYKLGRREPPLAGATGSTWTAVSRLLPAGLLALALAAHFFLPALVERSLAQLEPVTSGYFYFGNHFRGADLVQPEFLFNYDPAGGRAFHTGLVQAITAVGGLVGLLWLGAGRGRKHSSFKINGSAWSGRFFVLLTLILATFMITPLSRPLWEQLPLLAFAQFPWRFLSVQAFAAALAASGLALLPGRRLIVPGLILLFLVTALSRLETASLMLADGDVTPERLAQYEWFTGNIGSTISAEYLPHSVQPRAYTSPWLNSGQRDRVQPLVGELTAVRLVERRTTRQTWSVTVAPAAQGGAATLSFPTIHWPGWKAYVDGEEQASWPSTGSGLITLDLPPGEHQVELRLTRTPIRLAAELLSLAAVPILAWLLWPAMRRWRLDKRGMLLLGLLAGLTLAIRLWPEPRFKPGDLTWDFAQMGYLHHAPDGIPFENGLRLQSYEFGSEKISAGESLSIVLNWQGSPAVPAPPVTVSLATPAVNRFAQAPLLASETKALETGQMEFRFTIPPNAPPGLYVPLLQIEGSQALMSANRLRGDLFLRPIRVTGRLQAATTEGSPLDIRAIEIQQQDGGALGIQLAWLTRQPLNENYNFNLRLLDDSGSELARLDGQPGYGFLPSTGWPVGKWVDDWLALSLPEPLLDSTSYHLMAQLYEVNTGTAVTTRLLGDLATGGEALRFQPPVPSFDMPADMTPISAVFEADSGPVIGLHGYKFRQHDERIELTLYWKALTPGMTDYTRFVHLVDRDGDAAPVAQNDSMPRNNFYPTGQWEAGEVVADPLAIELSDVAQGTYQIVIGLYRNLGTRFPRLAVSDANGQLLPGDRVSLPLDIVVNED